MEFCILVCEMTECEAGCIRCLFVVLCPETACRFMTMFCELGGVATSPAKVDRHPVVHFLLWSSRERVLGSFHTKVPCV